MTRLPLGIAFIAALAAAPLAAQGAPDLDAGLQQLVSDYTALYRRDTFARWRTLFHPAFTAGSTTAEGGVATRTLDEFLSAQERAFAAAREMGERLENVRIERRGRIASVWADFVYWNDASSRRGRLVLLAMSGAEGWRFHSLLFTYHAP